MVEVIENVVTKKQIEELMNYMKTNDHTTDARPDVLSKGPVWDQDQFPQSTLKKILDQALGTFYIPEVVLFYESQISFRLHVDSGNGNQETLYKNILIPLWHDGFAGTVLFDNYWFGSQTRFSRTDASPLRYNLPDKTGKFIWVDNIQILLEQCQTCPELITNFDVTADFIAELNRLVKIRSTNGPRTADRRTNDYSEISNYKPNKKFDPEIHAKYINHIPIEDLHGLTIDRIVEWVPGSVIIFDRTQLHCATSGHTRKIGVSMFLNRK
jgi:hypothetical protein